MKTKLKVFLMVFLSAFSSAPLLATHAFHKDLLPQEVVDAYKARMEVIKDDSSGDVSFSLLAEEVARAVSDQKLPIALLEIEHLIENGDLQEIKKALHRAKAALYDLKKAYGCVRIGRAKNCAQEMSALFGRVERVLSHFSLKTDQQIAFSRAGDCTSACPSTCNPVTLITTAPFFITSPGHYCVAAPLTSTTNVPAITITSNNVELSLDLEVIDVNGNDIGILVDGSTVEISNIQIGGSGEIINAAVAGILVQGATDVLIENTILDTNDIGVLIQNDSSFITCCNIVARSGGFGVVTAADSVFDQNADIKIVNSEFRDNTEDAINISGVTDNLAIENCVIFSNEGTGVIVEADSLMDQVLIQNCFIGSNSIGLNLSFGSQNCLVQNVMVQDTKSDGILLANASNVTLENCLVDSIQGRGIEVSYGSKNLHIKNCEVSNTADSPFEAISVIDSIIEDSLFFTVADNQVAGMNLSRSDNFIIRNCLIRALLTDPTLALDPFINLVTGTNGITLQNCHGFIIEGNQIQTNAQTTNEIDGAGILLYGGNRDCVIRDCIVYNDEMQPASRGIAIINSPLNATNTAITVENCSISGATRNGIFVQGLHNSIIQNNMVSTTTQGTGLTIKVGDAISILGNLVMHNGHHGIHLGKDAENCAVRDNTSFGNGKVGIKAHEQKGSSSSRGSTNAIYHNFSYSNAEKNFVGVPLVVHPKRHVGVLENISD